MLEGQVNGVKSHAVKSVVVCWDWNQDISGKMHNGHWLAKNPANICLLWIPYLHSRGSRTL